MKGNLGYSRLPVVHHSVFLVNGTTCDVTGKSRRAIAKVSIVRLITSHGWWGGGCHGDSFFHDYNNCFVVLPLLLPRFLPSLARFSWLVYCFIASTTTGDVLDEWWRQTLWRPGKRHLQLHCIHPHSSPVQCSALQHCATWQKECDRVFSSGLGRRLSELFEEEKRWVLA